MTDKLKEIEVLHSRGDRHWNDVGRNPENCGVCYLIEELNKAREYIITLKRTQQHNDEMYYNAPCRCDEVTYD